jgi:hypothetical protein
MTAEWPAKKVASNSDVTMILNQESLDFTLDVERKIEGVENVGY